MSSKPLRLKKQQKSTKSTKIFLKTNETPITSNYTEEPIKNHSGKPEGKLCNARQFELSNFPRHKYLGAAGIKNDLIAITINALWHALIREFMAAHYRALGKLMHNFSAVYISLEVEANYCYLTLSVAFRHFIRINFDLNSSLPE